MKTGWPNHYILHLTTVSLDVKKVFAKASNQIAKYYRSVHVHLNETIPNDRKAIWQHSEFHNHCQTTKHTWLSLSTWSKLANQLACYWISMVTGCLTRLNRICWIWLGISTLKKGRQGALWTVTCTMIILMDGLMRLHFWLRKKQPSYQKVYSWSDWFLLRYETYNAPEFVLTIPYHKVQKIAFKIIHSTTILLQKWHHAITDLALK